MLLLGSAPYPCTVKKNSFKARVECVSKNPGEQPQCQWKPIPHRRFNHRECTCLPRVCTGAPGSSVVQLSEYPFPVFVRTSVESVMILCACISRCTGSMASNAAAAAANSLEPCCGKWSVPVSTAVGSLRPSSDVVAAANAVLSGSAYRKCRSFKCCWRCISSRLTDEIVSFIHWYMKLITNVDP